MLQHWQIVAIELAFPGCCLRSYSDSLYLLRGSFSIDGVDYDKATLLEFDGDVFDAVPGERGGAESWRTAILMLDLVRDALSLSGHERIAILESEKYET